MTTFNENEAFSPIWMKMESGELQSANNLRIILDGLGEKFGISTLHMLHFFRGWLLGKNIDLSTMHGAVSYSIVAQGAQKN